MREKGVVVKYWPNKKFGFILGSAGREIFFHCLEVQDLVELHAGQRVEYSLGEYNGKTVAKDVALIIPLSATIPATIEEVELLKSYGVDLASGAKVRAALEAIRSIKRGDQ